MEKFLRLRLDVKHHPGLPSRDFSRIRGSKPRSFVGEALTREGFIVKSKNDIIAFLGRETAFEGKLNFHGNMRIDGRFTGEINSDGTLIIGESGWIQGDIRASHIAISGEIHGNMEADERINVYSPGKVFGNIQAPSVVISEGVIFEGETRMSKPATPIEQTPHDDDAEEDKDQALKSTGTMYGVVTDKDTGNPIKDVTLTCKGLGVKDVKTNASGYYELTNLREGSWDFKIKAKGYRRKVVKVEISNGQTLDHEFLLEAKR
jgi:cytoskeletal protein CcmA (bactofilin family)